MQESTSVFEKNVLVCFFLVLTLTRVMKCIQSGRASFDEGGRGISYCGRKNLIDIFKNIFIFKTVFMYRRKGLQTSLLISNNLC